MVVIHGVTINIEIILVISLSVRLFFLLLHPASEEEKQRKKRIKTAMLMFVRKKEKKRELFERRVKRRIRVRIFWKFGRE